MTKQARTILTALVAVAAYLNLAIEQPHWAHIAEAVVLVVGASFGIRPPHED